MPNTIKTAIGWPPKLALDKVSYVNFFILAQIMKKFIISGRLCFSLALTFSGTSSTHNYLLILQGFWHFKDFFFFWWYHWWSLRWCKQWFGAKGYALVTKRNICFWTKVTIFLKSWSGNLCGNAKFARNQVGDVENRGWNLSIAVKMK